MRSRWVTKMTTEELRAEYDANLGRSETLLRNKKIMDELCRRSQLLELPKLPLDIEPERDPFGTQWLDWLMCVWDSGNCGRVFEVLRCLPRLVVACVAIKLYDHVSVLERNPETCFARNDFVRRLAEEARRPQSKPKP